VVVAAIRLLLMLLHCQLPLDKHIPLSWVPVVRQAQQQGQVTVEMEVHHNLLLLFLLEVAAAVDTLAAQVGQD
jgi:hypothetical protein